MVTYFMNVHISKTLEVHGLNIDLYNNMKINHGNETQLISTRWVCWHYIRK